MAETVVRIERDEGYTILPNGLLRDSRLSLKTKGLFCMMLSFPGNWSYSVGGLCAVCGAGRDTVRGALRELEAAGYLEREQEHAANGRFGSTVYTLHTVSSLPQTENPSTAGEAPQTDLPSSEKPTSENPPQQNKDYNNTPYSPPTPPEGGGGGRPAAGRMTPQGEGRQVRKRTGHDPDGTLFAAFWAAYPRKAAKDKALRAWRRLNPDEALCQRMAEALERCKASREWRKEGGAYIPYPATWLNGRRWEDEDAPLPEAGPSCCEALRPEGGRWL